MKLKIVELADAEKLLEFELNNQSWFEQFIPPRESGFYSLKGVIQHLREFQLEYKVGDLLPFLILSDEGAIIGRVNVSNLGNKRQPAHLGYRVGQHYTGNGVAKWAVSEALKLAQRPPQSRIIAYAATDNVASQKVLIANQFKKIKCVQAFAQLNGQSIDCIEFCFTAHHPVVS